MAGSATQTDRKRTQRARLLTGMTHVVARDGYAAATIAQAIADAGISRPTFYEHFANKDDCILAAVADASRRVAEAVERGVRADAPARALPSAVQTLIRFADTHPGPARLLIDETMAGGRRALDARAEAIAGIAEIVEAAELHATAEELIGDIPRRVLLGGIFRLLAPRLRRGEGDLKEAQGDLLVWIESYGQPAGRQRRRTVAPTRPFAPVQPMDPPLHAPPPLPPGRPRLTEQEVAANHRQRILLATAHAAAERGYTATTIADITRLSGLDSRAFYAQFADKHEAFMAAHELIFQRMIAFTAGAFFAAASWPERIWEASRAMNQFVDSNPAIAHVRFVESHAAGPRAVQRTEESVNAFTIFLQEGYQHRPMKARPSPLALEAIAATNFEIAHQHVRGTTASPRLSSLVALSTYVCLAPFIGPDEANSFVAKQTPS
jgi:AcrR family transcriptional regulator